MTSSGVFSVCRSIWDDPDFDDEAFTQREAMMWLISSAAWSDRSVRGATGPVKLDRGEFCFSVRFLADKWKWSKSRVGRFLLTLENRDTVRTTKRDTEKVYSIKNYNKLQAGGLPERDTERDTERDASGTAAGQQRDKEESLKHLNSRKTLVAKAPPDSSPVKEAFDAYNATAEKHGLSTARTLSPDRKRKLAARLREHGLDGWLNALGEIANAPFLLGKGERGWRAGLDFLLKPDKLNKLIEGSYRDQPRAGPGSGVRLNGTGWIIPHGTPEYAAWRKHYAVESSPSVYDFPLDKPGHEARAPARWPSQLRR